MKQIILTIFAFVCLVIGLSILGQARAQEVGCYQIDKYGILCIPSTGEIFVQEAHQKFAADGWIDRSHNKKGERCCDAGRDCHPVPSESVQLHRQGVILPNYGNLVIPGEDIMVSEDGRYWICLDGSKRNVRCFFAPYSGS